MIDPGPLCALLQFLKIPKNLARSTGSQPLKEQCLPQSWRSTSYTVLVLAAAGGQTYLSWEAANKVTRRYVATQYVVPENDLCVLSKNRRTLAGRSKWTQLWSTKRKAGWGPT